MERMFPQKQRTQFRVPKFLSNEDNKHLFIHWTSGLIGGLVSITLVSPLELARTRHILLSTTKSYGKVQYTTFTQTLTRIYKDEGFRGLYKGYNAAAVSIPVFYSLYFTIFYRTKIYMNREWSFKKRPIARDMLASLYTGFVCNTLTNPLWVIRTRIQAQYLHCDDTGPKYKGVVSGLRKMVREEGYRSLFKGMLATYMGLAHGAILFPLYEQLKKKLTDPDGGISNMNILLASNISKLIALVATYPHVVIRSRLQDLRTPKQSYNTKSSPNNATISYVIKDIMAKEGFKGLYNGLRIDLVRILPANSIMFVVFECVKKRLEEELAQTGENYN